MPAIAELPDIDQALARLDAAEAAETAPTPEAQTQEAELSATDQPAATSDDGVKPPVSKPTDTPATADKPADADKPKTDETQKPATDDKGSAFKKNAERLDKTWKSVNERKTQLDQTEATLKQREAQLQQREQDIQARSAKAERKFTPEQYDQASQNKAQSADQSELQADGLDRRAERLEEDGKFDEAERCRTQAKSMRDQATTDRALARQMKAYGDHLRNNPDPTLEQIKKQRETQLSYFTVEAAKEWPDLAVKNSEFQQKVAGQLQEAAKAGLDVNEHPVLVYHAARMVALQTAAARVPDLEKKLGEMSAKVKDLEKLTNPGGGREASKGISTAKPDADEESDLRAVALSLS